MTNEDRKQFLFDKSEELSQLMEQVADIRYELESNGFKAEAGRADTISSKLNILAENLADKARSITE